MIFIAYDTDSFVNLSNISRVWLDGSTWKFTMNDDQTTEYDVGSGFAVAFVAAIRGVNANILRSRD